MMKSTNTLSAVRLLAVLSLCYSATAFSRNAILSPVRPGASLALHAAAAGNEGIKTYLDDGNYNSIMKLDKTVLVDACAQWCGPCKLIEPFIVTASEKYKEDLEVVKFDVEGKNTNAVKVEFLLNGVMPEALPSLILFHEGKHIATHTGVLTPEELDEFISSNLKKSTGGIQKEIEKELAGGAGKGLISFASAPDDYAL